MNKNKWYDNEKDLATKPGFHLAWFIIWSCASIVGTKGIAYSLGWESYLLAIFSYMMLGFQTMSLVEVLKVYNKIRRCDALEVDSE